MNLSYVGKYDEYMDKECIPLCNALQSIKGIKTTESCCGHGKIIFRVYFKVTDLTGLFFVVRCVDRRYFKHPWKITLGVGDAGELPTFFVLESKSMGETAYKESLDLVANMEHHLNHKVFRERYKLEDDLFMSTEAHVD